MIQLPPCDNLLHQMQDGVLYVLFNRPAARNAMSGGLLDDIVGTFAAIRDTTDVRVVVLRGAGGNFCSGGDIKDMANARAQMAKAAPGEDPVAAYNRRFGAMLRAVNSAPQATIAICEGAVLGGGFGLACVADIAFARSDAQFGLPETGLGLPPAQIAPFVVSRIGLSQARRLGVCGARFDGEEARRLGIVHDVFADDAALVPMLGQVIQKIRRCAPGANAITKEIMLRVGNEPLDGLLDYGARKFSECVRGAEGIEGTTAFIEKRQPKWAL